MPLLLPAVLSTTASAFIGAAIPATIAAVVAIYVSVVGRKREDTKRRRDLYSEAYKLALEWCEAVYRVRRRASDGSQDRGLDEHFHQLQERIAYYEGWLAIEDEYLGKAYQKFIEDVRGVCQPLLQGAWSTTGREPTEPRPADEVHPDVQDAKRTFLAAVRLHLQPWWKTDLT
ncbi:MAG: hypothetical protein M3Y17_13595 [Actinomycetota bacterium]|nr:hypothetical protein [Actinomycetota bacterium]